ncbi:Alkaline phosphatase synthesis transcriptional regulatory protein SphR [compost metagenome]
MTPLEFNILDLLIENRGRVLSTRQIYENIWDEPYYNDSNTIAAHIRNIREKIEFNPKNPEFIKLVWGVGYKFDK